ncbi:translation initiation factor IF-2 [Streptomyces sp. SID5785]|uniref:translation initiation factor IF-2 n=1 Tax=Streptomyces sp. SID5785 TaxID=2690309 RepID=UPI0013612C02|nr:translation initiation factor IF-2 [Streptomyces sp. SID5785]MZD05402.1 translation initiation factor IF-2 [Streptomyces sp. SID5785]
MAEAREAGGGSGRGGTQFTGLTHEQMLAWLDQANSGEVQAAANRLAAAAKEIHKIADELKVRPQWVTWKGSGAEAFRGWAGDLANATVRLGDFSQESSKWLGEAANAIGTAQASIPRDKASAQANLDAAHSAHNDPDAQSIASKSSSELAAIKADKEKVRLEAAAEMTKLGQAYSLSSAQMDALERPKFPPPPRAIAPPRAESTDLARPGTGPVAGAEGAGGPASGSGAVGHASAIAPPAHAGQESTGAVSVSPAVSARPEVPEVPTQMGIDSVGTLPETARPTPVHEAPVSPTGPQSSGPVNASGPGVPPVAFGRGGGTPSATGRATGPSGPVGRASASPISGGTGRSTAPPAAGATGRPTTPGVRGGQMMPGQNSATGRAGASGVQGRMPTNNGVAGGRPQPATGKPTKGIPRGSVMGAEGTSNGRSATGQGAIGGRPASTGTSGARGTGAGRRVSGARAESGGIVGGRGQKGASGSRSFSSGGSGLVRGESGQKGPAGARSEGQNGAAGAPRGARPGSRRDEQGNERPDYVTEDESTWQPDDQRNVPSVVDDTTEKNER